MRTYVARRGILIEKLFTVTVFGPCNKLLTETADLLSLECSELDWQHFEQPDLSRLCFRCRFELDNLQRSLPTHISCDFWLGILLARNWVGGTRILQENNPVSTSVVTSETSTTACCVYLYYIVLCQAWGSGVGVAGSFGVYVVWQAE